MVNKDIRSKKAIVIMSSSSSSSSTSSSLLVKKRNRNEDDNNNNDDNDDNDNNMVDKRKTPGHGGIFVYKNPRRMGIQKSAVCLLAALQGQYVTVELKNDSEVYGKIDIVDGRMNIEMSDVKLKVSSSSSLENYNNYALNGNLIRYVHIPRSIDIKESVKVCYYYYYHYDHQH